MPREDDAALSIPQFDAQEIEKWRRIWLSVVRQQQIILWDSSK